MKQTIMKLLLGIYFLFLVGLVSTSPPIPKHSFEKRVLEKPNGGDKKVFVSFVQGPYTFKKRREKAGRVIFSCNGCQKFDHYLPVCATRGRIDSDPENDVYTLDNDTLPSPVEHRCGNSGIEVMVKEFRKELENEIRVNPIQPFPALYLSVRSKYTQNLPNIDSKNLFLSEIPSYDTIQATMYRIRREFIPPAPKTQSQLDVNLDWFLLDSCSQSSESIVKGDILHSNGLRVLLFASDETLKIMSRSRTILADGTFRITPHLWYQTFVLNAEFRTNQFVPVAFGLLPDKKRQSYDDLFSLLKQALEHPSRDLELSAEWVMSDFEHNIRTSWQSIFPNIKAKGCHFHFAKVRFLLFIYNNFDSMISSYFN